MGVLGILFTVRADWHLFPRVFGILFITLAVFSLSRLFWQKTAPAKREKIESFYIRMETPVDAAKEVVGSEDVSHLFLVGTLAMLVGIGLLFAAVFPNPASARVIIALTSLFIFAIGFIMYRIGRSEKSRAGTGKGKE